MIVDDSVDLLELMYGLLQGRHQITCAKDGAEALVLLRTMQVDFLITDYRMPNLDGVGLIEKIHEERILVENILLISSDLPEISVLNRLGFLSEGCFKFFSADKNPNGFDFIKKL